MAESSIRKRILHGMGANTYNTLVVAGVQLAGVPILLHAWGTQLYGGWLVLFSIPAYLSLANLGFSLSIANDMTTSTARGDRIKALIAFQSLIALVTLTGLIVAVAVTLVLFVSPLGVWLHVSVLSTTQIRWVLLLLSGEMLAQLSGGVSFAGFQASGEFGLSVALNTTVFLFQYAAIWGVALAGLGVVGAAAAFLAVRLAGSAVMVAYLVHRHPWLRLGFRHASLRYIRTLLTPSLANLTLPFATALKNQGLILVVNALLGPVAVVTFSVLRTLTRLSFRLVTIVSHAVSPELASAEGAEDQVLQRRLYLSSLQAAFWLSILAGIVLYFVGGPILRLWTHERVSMDTGLFLWLLAGAAISAVWYVSLAVLQALNRHQRAAIAYVLGGVIVLGTAWALVGATGRIAEAGLALFVGDALFAVYVLIGAARMMKVPLVGALVHILNPLGLVPGPLLGQSRIRFPEWVATAFRRGQR